MKFLTKKNISDFKQQGDTGEMSPKDIKIIAKFFNPTGAASWFCYEYNEAEDIFWCFANLGHDQFAECGTVSAKELREFRGRFGLGIERDLHFGTNHTLEDVIEFKVR